MRKIYFVRHGQTELNMDDRMQGWCDSPLTEKGEKQAAFVKGYFKENEITFDHAFCSDSGRAVQTIELITDMDYEVTSNLREISLGDLEGKSERFSCQDLSDEEFYKRHGGESFNDVGTRISEVMEQIALSAWENTLIVAHGGSCLYYLGSLGYPMDEYRYRLTNACIAVFDINDDGNAVLSEIIQNKIQ